MDWDAVVARNVRLRRQALGLSQEELAEKAGLSVRYIGNIERNRQSASVRYLGKLAAALSVSPADLIAQ